jgi:hypothetical protein
VFGWACRRQYSDSINISMCLKDNESWLFVEKALEILDLKSFYHSPHISFGWLWFASFVTVSQHFSGVLWDILTNFGIWRGIRANPRACSQLYKKWNWPGNPQICNWCLNEGCLVEHCVLHLWSLHQLWIVGDRSHCRIYLPGANLWNTEIGLWFVLL